MEKKAKENHHQWEEKVTKAFHCSHCQQHEKAGTNLDHQVELRLQQLQGG